MRHVADLLPPVGVALERPTSSKAWDLRAAWAAGWRVSVTLDAADVARLEGHVTRVAATDAFVVLAGQRATGQGWRTARPAVLRVHEDQTALRLR